MEVLTNLFGIALKKEVIEKDKNAYFDYAKVRFLKEPAETLKRMKEVDVHTILVPFLKIPVPYLKNANKIMKDLTFD